MSDENFSDEEIDPIAFHAALFPLIKYLNNNEVDVDKINYDEYARIIKSFGKDSEYAFQIHDYPFETHEKAITFSIDNQQYISAAALMAITLEESINGLIRFGCLTKDYSQRSITRFISELGTKSKIDLILPLLGFQVPDFYKTAIHEFAPIRNKIVHNKAMPSIHTYNEDSLSSRETNESQAKSLVLKYPLQKVMYSCESMVDLFITQGSPVASKATSILTRFLKVRK